MENIKFFKKNTGIHIALLAIFAWLIFYNTQGQFSLRDDCVLVIQPFFQWEEFVKRGFFYALQSRGWCPTSMNMLYHAVGESHAKCNLIYIAIFLLSCTLLYAFLRSIFTPNAAFFGALFYLGYAGKYETVTWFAAGMYQVVMILAIIALGLTQIRIRPWLQAICISFVIGLSFPIFETLLMMLPVFPILYLGQCWREKRFPKIRDYAISFIPFIPALLHIAILSKRSNPIWERAVYASHYYELPLYIKAIIGAISAFDTTLGWNHIHQGGHGVLSFFQVVLPQYPYMWGLLVLGLVGIGYLISCPSSHTKQETKPHLSLYAIAGFYLMCFSGAVTFIIGPPPAPSRMTLLPSLGCSMVVAYLAHQAIAGFLEKQQSSLFRLFRWLIITSIIIGCMLESIALSSFIKQNEDAYKFDKALIDQIHSIQPRLPKGSLVFVNLPRPPQADGFWWQGYSLFLGGGAAPLFWATYQTGVEELDCFSTRRHPKDSLEKGLATGFAELIECYSQENQNRIFPFLVNNDGKVLGIKDIQILNSDGKLVQELSFPTMDNKEDRLITITVSQQKGAVYLVNTLNMKLKNLLKYSSSSEKIVAD